MAIQMISYRGCQIYCKNHEYIFTFRTIENTVSRTKVYSSRSLIKMHHLIDELIEYQFIGKEFDGMCLTEKRVNSSLNWIKHL